MEAAVECTHCRVVMTSWSGAGSAIRYYQCPFCGRTHSSLYGEVFRKRAGARLIEAPAPTAPAGVPMASPEDVRWARIKASATRWFARLADEEQRGTGAPATARALHVAADDDGIPTLDPREVIELAPRARGLRRRS